MLKTHVIMDYKNKETQDIQQEDQSRTARDYMSRT